MNERILFIIINDEIKFLTNPNKDHREWFLELGGKEEDYQKVIKGYIMDGMIVFFKENFNYDMEVINLAKKCAPLIRKQLGRPNLKVCCGIQPGQNGSKWEPIMTLTEEELAEAEIDVEQEQRELLRREEERKRQEEIRSRVTDNKIIEFKNDWEDPKFIKYATTFTLIILLAAAITKIILILNKTIILEYNRWIQLLIMVQLISPIITIIGYRLKRPNAKYCGIATTIASFFFFDIFDIIIGAFNLFFTVDHKYIIVFMEFVNNVAERIKREINRIKAKQKPMMNVPGPNKNNVKKK